MAKWSWQRLEKGGKNEILIWSYLDIIHRRRPALTKWILLPVTLAEETWMKNDGCSIKHAVINFELCCDFAKKLYGGGFSRCL